MSDNPDFEPRTLGPLMFTQRQVDDAGDSQLYRYFVVLASDGTVRSKFRESDWRFVGPQLHMAAGLTSEDWIKSVWLIRVSSCVSCNHAEAIAREFLAFAQKHGIEVTA